MHNTRFIWPLLAALIVCGARPAAAESLFDEFRSICVATASQQRTAVKVAEKIGFSRLPDENMGPAPLGLRQVKVMVRRREDALAFIITGVSGAFALPGGMVKSDVCMLVARPAEPSLEVALKTYAGVRSVQEAGFDAAPYADMAAYIFREKEGARTEFYSVDRGETASGEVRILASMHDRNSTSVLSIQPRP